MELMEGSAATSSENIWERQQNFLNAMSHELRTPLARIIASVELIKKTNPESNEMNNSLDVIYSEAFRMAKLIDDMLLLTASNINHRSVNWDEIEIDSLLISVFETYHQSVKNKISSQIFFLAMLAIPSFIQTNIALPKF